MTISEAQIILLGCNIHDYETKAHLKKRKVKKKTPNKNPAYTFKLS